MVYTLTPSRHSLTSFDVRALGTPAPRPGGRAVRRRPRRIGDFGPYDLIGPAQVSKSGGTASSAFQSSVAGAAQGFAVGGPIGAGIGAIAGAIAGIWASHAARAKGAKTENEALNSALQAFDAALQQIFQAANTGQITGLQGAQLCQTNLQSFWQGMAPYTTGPGRADKSNGGANCGQVQTSNPCGGMSNGPMCNSSCTATCCVGCQDLTPTIAQAVAALSSPTGGSVTACTVAGSKYGATARASYTLTYTPGGAAGSGASSVFGGLTGSSSSSSLVLIALVLGGVFLATR